MPLPNRLDDALSAAVEAVGPLQSICGQQPEVYDLDLAAALQRLAEVQNRIGDRTWAFAASNALPHSPALCRDRPADPRLGVTRSGRPSARAWPTPRRLCRRAGGDGPLPSADRSSDPDR